MLGRIAAIWVLGTGVALACSGTSYNLQGQLVAPGVYEVNSYPGWLLHPTNPGTPTPVGTFTVDGFRNHIQGLIAANELVFIASIDSIIMKNFGSQDTAIPGFTPDFVLKGQLQYPGAPGFYGRMQVDTVLKGTLPSKAFWFRGHPNGTSCDVNLEFLKFGKFLNYSNKLDSMPDLKISMWESFCGNCPRATTFDGRFFWSPEFPTVPLDIRELFPGYPVALSGPAREFRPPLRAPGPAYRPDGRAVPESGAGRSPVPLVR